MKIRSFYERLIYNHLHCSLLFLPILYFNFYHYEIGWIMSYSKKDQLTKATRTTRTCGKCDRKRLIKFYDTPRSLICNECKRKAKRVKKQNSKTYVTNKLDAKWSLEVKEIAGFKCEYCGKTEYLNSHHIFSRSNRTVRFDTDNGICLCSGHHTLKSDFSAHKTPTEFVEWIKEYRGLDWYERLRQKATNYFMYHIDKLLEDK